MTIRPRYRRLTIHSDRGEGEQLRVISLEPLHTIVWGHLFSSVEHKYKGRSALFLPKSLLRQAARCAGDLLEVGDARGYWICRLKTGHHVYFFPQDQRDIEAHNFTHATIVGDVGQKREFEILLRVR